MSLEMKVLISGFCLEVLMLFGIYIIQRTLFFLFNLFCMTENAVHLDRVYSYLSLLIMVCIGVSVFSLKLIFTRETFSSYQKRKFSV